MSTITPELKELAERLLAREALNGQEAEPDVRVAFRVCQGLRQPLVTFAGAEGFRSLLSRSLTLAKAQAPGLAAIRVNPDGSLELPGPAESQLDQKETAAAGFILVAQLLDLLVTLIGNALTLRLVERAWPDLNDDTYGKRNNI